MDGSDPPAGYTGVVAVNSTTSNGGVADLSPRSNATNSDEAGAEDDTRVVLPSGASMPYDVLIGISIGGFRKPASGGGKEWGLRGSRKSTSNTDGTEGGEGIRRRTEEGEIEEGAGEQRDHHDEAHDGSDGDGGDGAAAAVAAQNGTGYVESVHDLSVRMYPFYCCWKFAGINAEGMGCMLAFCLCCPPCFSAFQMLEQVLIGKVER